MKLAVAVLVVLLLVSNAWWAYVFIDSRVSHGYQSHELEQYRQAMLEALALLPVAASPTATRREVVEAAQRRAAYSVEPFEKDGYVWVGRLGLKFDGKGRLVEAVPGWSPE